MKKAILIAGALLSAYPAYATDNGGNQVYNQTFDESVTQKTTIWQRLTNRQAQRQQQAQGQRQSQQAYGGNANASNSGVQVDNRNYNVTLPNVSPTAPCQGGFAIGGFGVGGGASFDRGWCRAGVQAQTLVGIGGSQRAALYAMCADKSLWQALAIDGVACHLKGQDLVAYETSIRKAAPKPKKIKRKARKVSKPVPTPTARPVKEACSCR